MVALLESGSFYGYIQILSGISVYLVNIECGLIDMLNV